MNISIIIGLLIALFLICKTIIVVSSNKKEYDELKRKWDKRSGVITDIAYHAGKVGYFIGYALNDDALSEDTKDNLSLASMNLCDLIGKIKHYEYKEF